MAKYKDKRISIKEGYGDTNINVFTLASLPFNDVFDYEGLGSFVDKLATTTVLFKDRLSSFSEPILAQDNTLILSQTKESNLGYYRGMLTSLESVANSDNFSKLEVESATNFSDDTTNE
jgi:hypothetical protein